MTPSQLDNLYQDSLYFSVNSDPPKDRLDIFYQSVREELVKEHTAKVPMKQHQDGGDASR